MIRVVKIGGNVVDDPALLAQFCADFAELAGPKVLVHGGGVKAGALQRALGQEPVRIEGRRVTDAATLEVVVMAYAVHTSKLCFNGEYSDVPTLRSTNATLVCVPR